MSSPIMAKNPIESPMESPLGDWREILRILHTGAKEPSKPLAIPKEGHTGVHISMMAISKPKIEKGKKSEPLDLTSLLPDDKSPLRAMLNSIRKSKNA